jgi:steroid delta-isomerase-like uncharacterized protein
MHGVAHRRTELKAFAERWMSLWAGDDLRLADEIHDPRFVDRSPSGRGCDLAAFKSGISNLYAAFPDFCAAIERLVIDEDTATVAIRWTATGHHRAAFMGHPATNARVRFAGIEIIRIEDGKVIERWGEWDSLAIAEQIDGQAALQR